MSEQLEAADLREAWPALSSAERAEGLRLLPRDVAEDLLFSLNSGEQAGVMLDLPPAEQRSWMRALALDDAADLLQEVPILEVRERLLSLLDDQTCRDVLALMAYREDQAGGLMNPRFARLRPEMTVDQAVTYLRQQTRAAVEMPYYAYVLDAHQRLLGVVSFRELMAAPGDRRIEEMMRRELRTVDERAGQEAVARLFRQTGLMAIPVLDGERRMKGIVTVDDIVEVESAAATEDIQKLGGSASLGEPYLTIAIFRMIKKRAGWLTALFVGEMLTATAMGVFEKEIDKAVVLALFVPLIISSGGNSGSQATSLVVRAMALGAAAARLVPCRPPRALRGTHARVDPRRHRPFSHLALAGALPDLRGARHPGGAHRGLRAHRRGHVRDAGRIALALPFAAAGIRSGQRQRALRGHAGGRDRPRHLLQHRFRYFARHAFVNMNSPDAARR